MFALTGGGGNQTPLRVFFASARLRAAPRTSATLRALTRCKKFRSLFAGKSFLAASGPSSARLQSRFRTRIAEQATHTLADENHTGDEGDERKRGDRRARKPAGSPLTYAEIRLLETDLPVTMSIDLAAGVLQLSASKLKDLDQRGELRAIRVDGEYLYLRTRMIEYLLRMNGWSLVVLVALVAGLAVCRLGLCPGHGLRVAFDWFGRSHNYFSSCEKHHRSHGIVALPSSSSSALSRAARRRAPPHPGGGHRRRERGRRGRLVDGRRKVAVRCPCRGPPV